MIAITVNKISTPCIPPHLLLSIFSFLWENVKPYTKGTIFVSRPFIMAKGVIHMAEIHPIYKKVIDKYSLELNQSEVELVLKALDIWADNTLEQIPENCYPPGSCTLAQLRKLRNDITKGLNKEE
jgi:hypothetical protein